MSSSSVSLQLYTVVCSIQIAKDPHDKGNMVNIMFIVSAIKETSYITYQRHNQPATATTARASVPPVTVNLLLYSQQMTIRTSFVLLVS